jgi:hypothetical protein
VFSAEYNKIKSCRVRIDEIPIGPKRREGTRDGEAEVSDR